MATESDSIPERQAAGLACDLGRFGRLRFDRCGNLLASPGFLSLLRIFLLWFGDRFAFPVYENTNLLSIFYELCDLFLLRSCIGLFAIASRRQNDARDVCKSSEFLLASHLRFRSDSIVLFFRSSQPLGRLVGAILGIRSGSIAATQEFRSAFDRGVVV